MVQAPDLAIPNGRFVWVGFSHKAARLSRTAGAQARIDASIRKGCWDHLCVTKAYRGEYSRKESKSRSIFDRLLLHLINSFQR